MTAAMSASSAKADANPLLLAERLNAYDGGCHVLRNVSLRVMPQEIVALHGRGGMGKTALMRCLMGLLPPRTGRVYLNGRDCTALRPSRIARAGLVYVPRDGGIFPDLTVEENLRLAPRPGRAAREAWTPERLYGVMPPLAECRLLRGDRLPAGERALAATARALMGQPDIVLFDAVAEGLASAFRSNLWDAVRIGAAAGVAWVIADAPLEEVGLETQRHVVMSRGEIVFDGSTGALKSDAALVRRHLGV